MKPRKKIPCEIDLEALGEAVFQKRLLLGNRRRPQAASVTAEAIGVATPTVTRTENAERYPCLDTYVKFCRWLAVPMETFLMKQEASNESPT